MDVKRELIRRAMLTRRDVLYSFESSGYGRELRGWIGDER